ncbi:MAG: acetylserine transporter [Gammaproteobacteria bacterium RIFCSPHIGHO2_12_FULL_42_10]|nr:MAG: acetylserine transporter [Gammaproteobacteria bacterium RIFCSPHIGHO2_12_FULL_42_10]
MRFYHLALALLVSAIWGLNFVVIHYGLKEISPQLLCMSRFAGASFPAIFFIKKPKAPFKLIILYGLVMFAIQFTLLFFGMQLGVSPSLSSLLMQTQVFLTIFLAFLFLGEKANHWQLLGAVVSFSGIVLVGRHIDGHLSLLGFILIIAAALAWSIGNLISKKIGQVNMFSLVVWGSFIAWIPLFLMSLYTEGLSDMIHIFTHLSWVSIIAVLYTTYLSTVVGYVSWNWLLSKYDAAVIVPFTLLVPIFAFLGATLLLREPLQPWKLIAATLVVTGLCISLLAQRLILQWKSRYAAVKPC